MVKVLFKKNIWSVVSTVVLVVMLSGTLNMVTYASEQSKIESCSTVSSVQPRSAIIEYRYKVVNGDLYRRLYNYTEQCWVGDWELIIKGN